MLCNGSNMSAEMIRKLFKNTVGCPPHGGSGLAQQNRTSGMFFFSQVINFIKQNMGTSLKNPLVRLSIRLSHYLSVLSP